MNRRFERLDARRLLAGDMVAGSIDAIPSRDDNPSDQDGQPAEIAPQYEVNHPPRLQPGNIPLVDTPAFDGMDRVDIIWQTVPVGEGNQDAFRVQFRQVGSTQWNDDATMHDILFTDQGRFMHSATLRELAWDTDYEYRVEHLRGGEVIETYQHQFRTRLAAGDPQPISFAAYGDSSRGGPSKAFFNSVQRRISQQNLDFSVLLGDNIYTFGTHPEADNRFTAELSPEAVAWTSSHIDYFAIGNHDIFADSGQPSRDLYSVPVPDANVNARASLPDGEFPEHTYSFDYGNVHFVTFDSNVSALIDPQQRASRLRRLLDYVVADVEASEAPWKIVFAHHPFIGTEKLKKPDDIYFQQMVTRLNDASVDLVLVGHSHSYSWTHPIIGSADHNRDGTIEDDEVDFVRGSDQSYEKGAGLIQLVSGAGGGSLRYTTYDQALFAKGYSQHESTGPLEYGFARVDVNPRSLTVSYISAATGDIMGDTNANGQRDPDEAYFGQFEIVDTSITDPDFNADGKLDDADIDQISAAVRAQNVDLRFDLDGDQLVTRNDTRYLLRNYLGTRAGDANLDGRFDSRDLVSVFQVAEYEDDIVGNSGWADGDWNGDGEFTSFDLVVAMQEGSYTVDARQAVFVDIQAAEASRDDTEPEPAGCGICGLACFMNCGRRLKSSEYRPD